MQTRIDEETVAELRDAVCDLLRDEDARAQSLTARATGLAGFVGVIVAVLATVWPGVGDRARWLKFGYVLVALGLLLTAVAGTIATIDAYQDERAPMEQSEA